MIVSDLMVGPGIGLAVGYLAWKKANFPWWVLLLTCGLGLVWAMYRLYLVSQKEDWNE